MYYNFIFLQNRVTPIHFYYRDCANVISLISLILIAFNQRLNARFILIAFNQRLNARKTHKKNARKMNFERLFFLDKHIKLIIYSPLT